MNHSSYCCASINNATRVDYIMPMLNISDQDAVTIGAILRTHAEMQDARTLESMELIGRMKRDDPEGCVDMIDTLQEQIDTFEGDCDELRRIANIFSVS